MEHNGRFVFLEQHTTALHSAHSLAHDERVSFVVAGVATPGERARVRMPTVLTWKRWKTLWFSDLGNLKEKQKLNVPSN